MNKNRILLLLVITLALLNAGLIYIHFFSSGQSRKGGDRMHSWLDRSLKLTDEQEAQHVSLRNEYFAQLRDLNDTIRLLKAKFVSLASQQELTDSLSDRWSDSIGQWQRRADELTYRHVRKVRSMLDAGQQPVWDSLIQIVMLRKKQD